MWRSCSQLLHLRWTPDSVGSTVIPLESVGKYPRDHWNSQQFRLRSASCVLGCPHPNYKSKGSFAGEASDPWGSSGLNNLTGLIQKDYMGGQISYVEFQQWKDGPTIQPALARSYARLRVPRSDEIEVDGVTKRTLAVLGLMVGCGVLLLCGHSPNLHVSLILGKFLGLVGRS
eukprot:TRINITY_DN66840_c8_g8_i1.p1 TRINITY_DN66840_c8_g8~~TRINITY_DN66840_c8_g8_i1.p1  ORF type:complete len:173 (+),score=1.92 TRINITY_DN66840_c8_g8_i1:71-589(+)